MSAHFAVATGASYLIVTWSHEGVIAQIAADVGGDDLTVDAIARHKVFVLPGSGRRRRLGWGARLSRHGGIGR